MAQKLDENEMVSFKELLKANSIQVDALAQLLIEEGIITQEKFFIEIDCFKFHFFTLCAEQITISSPASFSESGETTG
jgi:hypothetical protein